MQFTTDTQMYYTAQEIAERYRITKSSVCNWIRAGKLKARRAGRQWRITQEDWDAFSFAHMSSESAPSQK